MKDYGQENDISCNFVVIILLLGPVVESKTITGTKKHKRGVVEANIVKANIPVQNGIVHLIDKPLVIMASTLHQHLCEGPIQVRQV